MFYWSDDFICCLVSYTALAPSSFVFFIYKACSFFILSNSSLRELLSSFNLSLKLLFYASNLTISSYIFEIFNLKLSIPDWDVVLSF